MSARAHLVESGPAPSGAPATLTPAEREVVELLARAWNRAQDLPAFHPSDVGDLCNAIHAAQRVILARPALRVLRGRPRRQGLRIRSLGVGCYRG